MILGRLAALAVVLLLSACGGPYVLQGRVVSGEFGAIDFVDAGDERLEQRGVASAEVRLHRDPGRPNMAQAGRALSGGDGRFQMTIDAFGAGWLEEVWRISVARRGFVGHETILPLPRASAGRELLIIVAPGYVPPDTESEDVWEIYEKYR